MRSQNLKVKAVYAIRNLVIGLSNDWKDLKSLDDEIGKAVDSASNFFIDNTPQSDGEKWINEIRGIEKNLMSLKKIKNQVVNKINNKEPEGLDEIWNSHKIYSSDLLERLNTLNKLGKTQLPDDSLGSWTVMWDEIFDKFHTILQLVEGSGLHLSMISKLAPDELDELTVTIVKNMPKGYTMEEALQYEKEYMEAYDQLKNEATQKKNLWDRFLDILAGGVQQSPAEMVMMQRWVNGEKGEL